MTDVTSGADADQAIQIARFRACVSQGLPKTRSGYAKDAVDAMRAETLAFIDRWAANASHAQQRTVREQTATCKELAALRTTAGDSTRRAEEIDTELVQTRTQVADLQSELHELTTSPDHFDEMAAEVAQVLRTAAELAGGRRGDVEAEMTELRDRTKAATARSTAKAEKLLAQAVQEAANLRTEADSYGEAVRAAADSGAEQLREEALAEAHQTREDATERVLQIRDDAERLAAVTLFEAARCEQEAHDRADAAVESAAARATEMVEAATADAERMRAIESELRAGLAAAGTWLVNSAELPLGSTPNPMPLTPGSEDIDLRDKHAPKVSQKLVP